MSEAIEKSGVSEPRIIVAMKVKLPPPNPRPSDGYDENRSNVLFLNKPEGFEIVYEGTGIKWPVDANGFTWIPLYVSSSKDAIARLIERLFIAEHRLDSILKIIKGLI